MSEGRSRRKRKMSAAGRERQKAAMRAYWERWRREHGREPKDTPILKAISSWTKPRRTAVLRAGKAVGYAFGKAFGDVIVSYLKNRGLKNTPNP